MRYSLRLRQTNAGASNVIHRVPLPQECISKNSKRADGLGEVHTHKGRDTRSLNFQDVIKGTNSEVMACKREGEIGKSITLVAFYGILSVEGLLSTNLL